MIRAFVIVSAVLSITSITSIAQANEPAPAGTQLILRGQDRASGQPCALFVMEAGFRGSQAAENFYAIVLSSYDHNGEKHDPIEVRWQANRPGAMGGTAANGRDQFGILLEPAQPDLANARSFNVRWWHRNHYHTERCVNLRASAN